MNKAIKEVTNIGIPCYESLPLQLQEMTLLCSKKVSNGIYTERQIRQEAQNRLYEAIESKSMNKNQEILAIINFFANDKSESVLDIDKKQRLINSLSKLVELDRNSTKDEMKRKIKTYIIELLTNIKYINNHNYTTEFHDKMKYNFTNLYYGRQYGEDFRKYLNNEGNYYLELLHKIDKIQSIDYTDLFDYYSNTLEPEKLAMFLAYNYLQEANKAAFLRKDISLAKQYLFYVNAYLNTDFSKNLDLTIKGKKVNYKSIKEKYNESLLIMQEKHLLLLNRNNFLNKNIEDNKKLIKSLLELKSLTVDESFVKPGHDYKKREEIKNNHSKNNTSEEILKEINDQLDYRLYTYLNNNPIAQITCDNSFSNYYAFLYENGMITADRFKGINSLSELKKDAIYVFDALNFEEKVKSNKQQLMGNTPRIYHNSNWNEKVTKIANKTTNEELQKQTKILVKKITK